MTLIPTPTDLHLRPFWKICYVWRLCIITVPGQVWKRYGIVQTRCVQELSCLANELKMTWSGNLKELFFRSHIKSPPTRHHSMIKGRFFPNQVEGLLQEVPVHRVPSQDDLKLVQGKSSPFLEEANLCFNPSLFLGPAGWGSPCLSHMYVAFDDDIGI